MGFCFVGIRELMACFFSIEDAKIFFRKVWNHNITWYTSWYINFFLGIIPGIIPKVLFQEGILPTLIITKVGMSTQMCNNIMYFTVFFNENIEDRLTKNMVILN